MFCFFCLVLHVVYVIVIMISRFSISSLEYDALSRLGIDNPLVYIRQRYKEKKDLYILESCVLGPSVLGEVTGSVEDTVKVLYKWVDVMVSLCI